MSAETAPPTPPDLSAFDRPIVVDSTDGLRLALYDLGGTGPDLLLVHATGFCAGVWEPLVSHLSGFRVAALDVRGHGRSEAPELDGEPGMSWAGTGLDVLAAVDELGLRHPIGVGHSMGGASLLIAELDRPGTFRSMWMFEPIVFPPVAADAAIRSNPLSEGARRRRSTFESATAARDNFAAKPPLSELSPEALDAYVHHGFEHLDDGSVELRCRPEVEAATYEMGPRHGTFERLGEIHVPVTVARGREEPMSPSTMAPAVADGLPAGRLEEHPELGHFGPLQDPAAMAASIAAAVTPDP